MLPTPSTANLPQLIESDDSTVQQVGTWTVQVTKAASGGAYLYSSGNLSDSLVLAFEGNSLDIFYIKHPALGSFAVDIDDQQMLTVNATASSSVFGERAAIRNLTSGTHTARIAALSGTIAIDAFQVESSTSVDVTPTSIPTAAPNAAPTAETSTLTPTPDLTATATLVAIPAETVTPDSSVMPSPTLSQPTKAGDTPTMLPTPPTADLSQLIESDDSAVQQVGIWTVRVTKAASGGAYLYSSGNLSDSLVLAFEGHSLNIFYIKHPALGSFAVDIDGQRMLIVNATASSSVFGERAAIRNLTSGIHTARITALSGTSAIDAFQVESSTSTSTATPSAAPTAEASTLTSTPDPTATATFTVVPAETVPPDEISITAANSSDSSSLSRLSGQVKAAVPSAPVTLTLVGDGLSKTMVLLSDGTFALALPPGIYQLTIAARHHLPYMGEVQLTDQPLALPTITLVAGDVNEDGLIDVLDAHLIAINFGLSVPPAPLAADVNGDGTVNIYDLVIVSANMKTKR